MKTLTKISSISLLFFFVSFSLNYAISGVPVDFNHNEPAEVCKEDKSLTNPDAVVNFTSFVISKKGQYTILKWSTSHELYNTGFSIERSSDNELWESIGLVEGQTKSCDYVDYMYIDKSPDGGTNFYRVTPKDLAPALAATKVLNVHFKELKTEKKSHEKIYALQY